MKIKTKKISKKILAGAFALSLAFPCGNLVSNNAKATSIAYPEPVVGQHKNLAWLDKQNKPSFPSGFKGVGWSFENEMNELSWAGYKVMSVDDPRLYEGLTEENKEIVKNYPQETDKFDKYFDYIISHNSSGGNVNEKKEKLKYPNYSVLLTLIEVGPGYKIEEEKRYLTHIIYVDPTDENYHYNNEYDSDKAHWYEIKNNIVEKYKKDVAKQLVVLNQLDKIRLQIENNPELDKDLVVNPNTRTAFFKGEERKKGEWKENEYGRWYVYQDGTHPKGETVVIDGVSYTFDTDGYLSTKINNSNANNNAANNTSNNNSNIAPEKKASWQSNATGWWYQNADGSYPANEWKQINGEWYWFNQDGYMQISWQSVAGTWYYLGESGAMAHDTWINGIYYVGSNGAMLTNTTTPDGYAVDENGVWIQNTGSWQSNSTGWWYQNADGSYPANEWQQIDGSWYYFNESGYMVASIWIGNYYLGENGAMLTNTTTPDGYVVDENGLWIA